MWFWVPLSWERESRSRLLRQHSKKWRPATRLHTKNDFPAAARLLRVHLRTHDDSLQLSRAFLFAHEGHRFSVDVLLSLISARPPLTRATRSASTRPKNGDGRAGPAFYPHVTDARRGEVGGRKEVGVWRRQRTALPANWRTRCQSRLHVTARRRLVWQTIKQRKYELMRSVPSLWNSVVLKVKVLCEQSIIYYRKLYSKWYL